MENRLDDERALDRGVGVELRPPAGPGYSLLKRRADGLLVDPEGHAPALNKGAVVSPPVADAVPEDIEVFGYRFEGAC